MGAGDPLGPGGQIRGSVGSYRLLTRLGSGAMGQVFLARSDRGRTVAVKLVRQELARQEEFRARFRQEVRAARRVGGPWTAPVLDADTEADVPWVATGYVAGPSLQRVVGHDHGPLPERSVRILAAGLAGALQDIHAAGLVHRDLKPSNVLVTIDGPRVIDFGVARALQTVTDGGLTRTGALVGSPAFMAPEQVRGERITPACDVFSLGSVLAYAATGVLPFGTADSGVHALMFRIAQEEPDLRAVPESLADLVGACLRKDPAARPSVAEIVERSGAGDTVADGRLRDPWLPSALVAQLGRHAVQLLDTENPAGPGPAPGGAEEQRAADAPQAAVGSGAAPRPAAAQERAADGTGAPRAAAAPGASAPDDVPFAGPSGGAPSAGQQGAAPSAARPGGVPFAGQPGAAQPGAAQPGAAGPHASVPHARTPVGGSQPAPGRSTPAQAAPQQPAPTGPTAPSAPPSGHRPPPYAAAPPYGSVQQPAGHGHPHPPQGGPGVAPPYHGTHAGSPTPYSTPAGPSAGGAAGQQPRRGGRSTALLVAAALVVALGSGGAVYALMRGGTGGSDDTAVPGPSPAVTAAHTTGPGPSSTPSASPSPSPSDGAIPSAYLGTWTTTITNAYGDNPRRLTLSQGAVGDTVLTLVADGPTDGGGSYHCVFQAPLTRAPGGDGTLEIGPSTVTVGKDSPACRPGEASQVSLLPDGRLRRVNTTTGEGLVYRKD
ncbi:serine/threonine-protein kinase [Streptomyces thermodiastaticus]|uniref:serine/threonine-protein kinase n=1 Tax=Streptomyces thermodiastaticus TaxID=44061 RepID=UPI001674971B|nr:serine/threonine-protein kinase [Streptomyces thermodiastaticus]MCE7551689.1 protein kinase [Streptomyces thermodiastaticus]